MPNIKSIYKTIILQSICKHKWEIVDKPYIWDFGRTKRANVKCIKCNKDSNKDIFELGGLI